MGSGGTGGIIICSCCVAVTEAIAEAVLNAAAVALTVPPRSWHLAQIMGYIVMADIVMACIDYGPYSYGLYSWPCVQRHMHVV